MVPPERVTLTFGDRTLVVERLDDGQVQVDGTPLTASAGSSGLVRFDGVAGGVAWAVRAGDARWVYHDGCVYVLDAQREGRRRRSTAEAGTLAAPMPATVREIRVKIGDRVSRGDTLIVLEAMKMELPVRANADGTVAAIHCSAGDLVQPGRALVALDRHESP